MYKIHILYKVKDGLKAKSFLPYTQIYTHGGKVTMLKKHAAEDIYQEYAHTVFDSFFSNV